MIEKLHDARFMKRLMGYATLFFILLIPVAHLTGLVNSIVFVNDLSLIALVLSAGAWWAAAGAEETVEEEA